MDFPSEFERNTLERLKMALSPIDAMREALKKIVVPLGVLIALTTFGFTFTAPMLASNPLLLVITAIFIVTVGAGEFAILAFHHDRWAESILSRFVEAACLEALHLMEQRGESR